VLFTDNQTHKIVSAPGARTLKIFVEGVEEIWNDQKTLTNIFLTAGYRQKSDHERRVNEDFESEWKSSVRQS
jgi:hypothetical protein